MSGDFQFDRETTVFPAGEHRWTAHISEQYNIGDKPNGGYLVAVAGSAMRQVSTHPDPISVTTHFLRPGTPDAPAEVTTEVVRVGRSLTTVRASLSQEGKVRLVAIGAFGDLSASNDAPPIWTTPPPELPPLEECTPRTGDAQGVELPIMNRVDIRVPAELNLAGGSAEAVVVGWVRFSDGREPDSHALTLFADAFPPPLFAAMGQVGWVPTIELTVHVRKTPTKGWMRGRFACHDLTDGRFIEDGMLWDSTGNVVAQSRQLGLLLTPPS